METLNSLLRLVILGFTVEAVVETLKLVYKDKRISIPVILSLIVGVLVAIAVNLDLLDMLGFNPIFNYVGIALTGVLISRGGNFVHDWISKLEMKGKE